MRLVTWKSVGVLIKRRCTKLLTVSAAKWLVHEIIHERSSAQSCCCRVEIQLAAIDARADNGICVGGSTCLEFFTCFVRVVISRWHLQIGGDRVAADSSHAAAQQGVVRRSVIDDRTEFRNEAAAVVTETQ